MPIKIEKEKEKHLNCDYMNLLFIAFNVDESDFFSSQYSQSVKTWGFLLVWGASLSYSELGEAVGEIL